MILARPDPGPASEDETTELSILEFVWLDGHAERLFLCECV